LDAISGEKMIFYCQVEEAIAPFLPLEVPGSRRTPPGARPQGADRRSASGKILNFPGP